MKGIIDDNNLDVESGFYYDTQRANKLTRVTLHANSKPPKNAYDPWPGWIGNSDDVNPDFPKTYKDDNQPDIDESNDPMRKDIFGNDLGADIRYGRLPLCSSIIQEDFNVSISNSWADFLGGNQLQDGFNQLIKPLGPYSDIISEGLSSISGVLKEKSEKKDSEFWGKIATSLNNFGGEMGKAGNVLTRSLVVQGTRFKYYSGSGISFGNLGMKFTLFSDWINKNEFNDAKKADWQFIDVDTQLEPLMPYSIGKYIPFFDNNDGGFRSQLDKTLADKLNIEGLDPVVNTFLAWQTPPGGFRPNVHYIDTIQRGTLKLKIGPRYTLRNLLIQDIQLNYSKQFVKYKCADGLVTCPLYCDVFITFTPATKFSSDALLNFVRGHEISSPTYTKITENKDGKEEIKGYKKDTTVTQPIYPKNSSHSELDKDINSRLRLKSNQPSTGAYYTKNGPYVEVGGNEGDNTPLFGKNGPI